MEYVWPLPPDEPRIRYVKSIWGEKDLTLKSDALDILAGEGTSNDLVKPFGVATDTTGKIFVTDTARRLVFVFDESAAKTSFLGMKEKPFKQPVCLAVDAAGRIYVTDTGYNTVLVFSADDRLLAQYGKDVLNSPSGVAVDNDRRRVYVVSTKSHRIEVFSIDDGRHLFGFGGRGGGQGQFNYPSGIAVGPDGKLFVVDSMNFRIQIFSSEGVYEQRIGGMGDTAGNFTRPKGIAIDAESNIYVTDSAFNNFQIFNPTGRLLLFIGSGGVSMPGEFSLPAGIHVDNKGRIFVADQLNRRVQIFERIQ
ncbi:MAG: 6-bladed beta-propeller [Thermodesulfovibrionales bacterium]